jgi:protein-S-isoprenylcysteine O-methyltransferase Ste14
MTQYTETAGDAGTSGAALPIRLLAFAYGVASYLIFFAAFLYFIAFVGGVVVPKHVDSGVAGSTTTALLVNLGLIALFGIQHSVMARQGFKRAWTKLVPRPAERSTYVLASAIILIAVMWLWQPMPAQVWLVENPAGFWGLWALFGLGWAVLLASTFMTDHFDLFGLRQVFLYLIGKPYTPVQFRARWLYRHMRHPLYTGFLIAFWATPDMTVGHLVLAGGFTAYIVVGTLLEERDLIAAFGEKYKTYAREMPRYLPRLRPRRE